MRNIRQRCWTDFITYSDANKNELCRRLDFYNIRYDLSYNFETRSSAFTILMDKFERVLFEDFLQTYLHNNVVRSGIIYDWSGYAI